MAIRTIPPNIDDDGKFRAVASGTLPSGEPVVVNSDGTVSIISETSGSQDVGSPSVFSAQSTLQQGATFDSVNNKVVISYRDNGNGNYGTAVVGTISGTSITFGTPVVYESAFVYGTAATFDSANGKVVVAYSNTANGNRGYSRVGTVSGTSISFGSASLYNSAGTTDQSCLVYDSANQKVVVIYRNTGTGGQGEAAVGTVSGTSVSWGTAVQFKSGDYRGNHQGATYDSTNGKVVIAYRNPNNSNYGTAIVGTVSGTSISFGSAVVFSTSYSYYMGTTYDSANDKVVIAYSDAGNLGYGTAVVGSVSGTSISFGSPVVFNTSDTTWIGAQYDSQAGVVTVIYQDPGNSNYGTFINGTVSGTSISFAPEVVFESADTDDMAITYDSTSKKVVISYRDNPTSPAGYGTAVVLQNAYTATNLTASNFIGFADGVVDEVAQSVGGESVFSSAITSENTTVYDTANDKIVVAYRDSSNSAYLTSVVGTVSGSSITFGTPVVAASVAAQYPSAVYDSTNGKVVVAYTNATSGDQGTAIVGTVSGTSISFGSASTFNAATSHVAAAYDSTNSKVVIAYRADNNSNYGTAVVGTVSGTSISFGSSAVYETANSPGTAITYDASNQKVVIVYQDQGNSFYATAVVGTVSGTSISFGTPVVMDSENTSLYAITYDSSNQRVVAAYYQPDGPAEGKVIAGTVSGTSISFGTPVSFDQAQMSRITIVYDPNAQKVLVTFRDLGNSNQGTFRTGTVSGTSITLDDPAIFNAASTQNTSTVYDPDSQKVVISFVDGGNGSYGTGVVVQPGYVSRGQVTDGNAAVVDIINTRNDNQLGLTTGAKYYVQTDGTLSTTPGTPSVFAGTAISATNILVKT